MSYHAIDCEMAQGTRGQSLLVRVSVVNDRESLVYDEVVRPSEPVADYREHIHGISPSRIQSGKSFHQVKQDVWSIIGGKKVIGHSLEFDLGVFGSDVPDHLRRDVATYPPFVKAYSGTGQKPSLKNLALNELGRNIQTGHHDSVEDAKACMALYNKHRHTWN